MDDITDLTLGQDDITDLTIDDGIFDENEQVVKEKAAQNLTSKRNVGEQVAGNTKPPRGPPKKRTRQAVKLSVPAIPVSTIPNVPGGPNSTSEIWDFFNRIEGTLRCRCNYCPNKTYAADPSRHGTTSLWNHYKVCKNRPQTLEDKKQKTLAFGSSVVNEKGVLVGSLKSVIFSIDDSRKDLAKMIMIDELPFRMVEGLGFKLFCQGMQPRFIIPSRWTVARDCLKIYLEEKSILKLMLKNQRVCLTTDTWTSIQNFNYMCITCHWIDDSWKYQKRILSFCQVPNHKGETIGKVIEACLKEWGIGNLLTITVDNASSNDGAIRHVKRRTKDWRGSILGHEFLHVRCCAHILNLIVKDGLDEIEDTIVKIRNAVRYVRSSPSRLESFKKCVEEENIQSKKLLSLDIETRWNSTYMMLEAAEKFEQAFVRLEEEDSKFSSHFSINENEEIGLKKAKGRGNKVLGAPNKEDWKNARFFNQYLEVFYHATLQFSGSTYVTSNQFFDELVVILSTLSKMIETDDLSLKAMAVRMKKKFDKYWDNLDNINFLLYIAAVLDPRSKMNYVKFCFDKVHDSVKAQDMTNRVETTMARLFDYYVQREKSTCGTSQTFTAEPKVHSVGAKKRFGSNLHSEFVKQMEDAECMENKNELGRYLKESCVPDGDSFSILSWWKLNESKYPILSKIAKDVLAIPVSTVASESAFSTSGRILDAFRSSLSPKMVEALICGQNWLRAGLKEQVNLRESMDFVASFDEFEPGSDLDGPSSIEVDD